MVATRTRLKLKSAKIMYKKEYLLERLQRAFTRKSIHCKLLPEKCEFNSCARARLRRFLKKSAVSKLKNSRVCQTFC